MTARARCPKRIWTASAWIRWPIRAGHRRTLELEHGEPIFATSSFVYGSAAQAAARFSGDEPGNIYSRFTNPTVAAFEATYCGDGRGREGRCHRFRHGRHSSTCMSIAGSRRPRRLFAQRVWHDHQRCSTNTWPSLGSTPPLSTSPILRPGSQAITDRTRLVFLETPSNPLVRSG